MHTRRMWTRWLLGLIVIVILVGAAAWLAARSSGGRMIHFWMDDATGLEPGTVVNLSGVRAGAVTHMSLDADPSRQNKPRAKIDVSLTTDAYPLVNPNEWIVAVTTSPLPGFKAEVDLVRRAEGEEPLADLVDGAWHAETRSAVTRQINLAFDALIHKLRGLSDPSREGGAFSFRELIPHLGAGDGKEGAALISMMLTPDQVDLVTDMLKKLDSFLGDATGDREHGGFARAALGVKAHDDLVRLLGDLAQTAEQVKKDAQGDGALINTLLSDQDVKSISDSLRNVHALTEAAAGDREHGGLVLAALGGEGHDNLIKITRELLGTASRLRKDLEDEDGALLRAILPRADYQNVSDALKNVHTLTETAAGDPEHGGLVRAALGAEAFNNLQRLTDELLQTAIRVRSDLEGEGGVLHAIMPPEDLDNLSRAMKNIATLTDAAAGDLDHGGFARAALGGEAYGNLLRLSGDLVEMADRLKLDMAGDGTMQHLLFTKEDSRKISDMIGNIDNITRQVAAIDLTPVQEGLRSMGAIREALDHMAGMITRLTAPGPGGVANQLEAGMAELPRHLQTVYGVIEKASRSTEEIMDQTAEVLRKASQTVSAINQLLTGLKRSWIFRGAFNEQLRYEDLAPYLVPSPGRPPAAGGQLEYEDLLRNLPE